MPQDSFIVDVQRTIGPLDVTGRIEVTAPFYGGSSGTPRSVENATTARILAERIEEAIERTLQEAANA